MRKLFLFMNISLDGCFEAPWHDISGFNTNFEAFSPENSAGVDTLLFGHRTYDLMKFWSTPEAQASAPEIAKFFNEKDKLVASHQAFDPGWSRVTVISGDVAGEVRKLKQQPGQQIGMFGSSSLCVSLVEAGLIDEFQIMVNPVVFGNGTTLFKGLAQKAEFRLVEAHPYPSGAVLLTYVPG